MCVYMGTLLLKFSIYLMHGILARSPRGPAIHDPEASFDCWQFFWKQFTFEKLRDSGVAGQREEVQQVCREDPMEVKDSE